jgi:hypothetical protein
MYLFVQTNIIVLLTTAYLFSYVQFIIFKNPFCYKYTNYGRLVI